jgi:hypothetical protein
LKLVRFPEERVGLVFSIAAVLMQRRFRSQEKESTATEKKVRMAERVAQLRSPQTYLGQRQVCRRDTPVPTLP